MLVICLLNNIVLRGRGFCTSSTAQITGNVPRLLADIVASKILNRNTAAHFICSSFGDSCSENCVCTKGMQIKNNSSRDAISFWERRVNRELLIDNHSLSHNSWEVAEMHLLGYF